MQKRPNIIVETGDNTSIVLQKVFIEYSNPSEIRTPEFRIPLKFNFRLKMWRIFISKYWFRAIHVNQKSEKSSQEKKIRKIIAKKKIRKIIVHDAQNLVVVINIWLSIYFLVEFVYTWVFCLHEHHYMLVSLGCHTRKSISLSFYSLK